MTVEKKLEIIADILDADADELKPETELSSLDWDSVTSLSFIAMMDEEFEKEVRSADIKKLITIQDMLDLMEK